MSTWIRRAAGLETRLPVAVIEGPELVIQADGDQLDQLLINLLRNGVDAAMATGGSVRVGWTGTAGQLEVWVEDEGPGLPNTGNLFVPFFTTKPHGSGIGLVLSREIAEAHGGSLALANRRTGRDAGPCCASPCSRYASRPTGRRSRVQVASDRMELSSGKAEVRVSRRIPAPFHTEMLSGMCGGRRLMRAREAA